MCLWWNIVFQLVVRLSLCSHPVWPCAVLTSDAPTCSDEVAWQQDCKSPKCNCYMFETRIFQSFIKVGVTVTDNWLRLYFHQLYSCLWCGDPIKYPGSVFFPFHNQQSSQFCKKTSTFSIDTAVEGKSPKCHLFARHGDWHRVIALERVRTTEKK